MKNIFLLSLIINFPLLGSDPRLSKKMLEEGNILLHDAIDKRSVELNKRRTHNGDDQNLYVSHDESYRESIEELLLSVADPEGLDPQGKTPLFKAISNKDIETVKILLACGANPNTIENGHDAMCLAITLEEIEIINTLLDAPMTEKNSCERGFTLLDFAKSNSKNHDLIKLLSDRGCVTSAELRKS